VSPTRTFAEQNDSGTFGSKQGAIPMIDLTEVQHELEEARKTRIRAQAAGRYLETMVARLQRSRQPWQWLDPESPLAWRLETGWAQAA
jgi:hypothetical protein